MTDTRDMVEMKRRFPLAYQIVTHDYIEARKRVAELEARMRKACELMDSHTSDDESAAQQCHERELYALMDVDP